MANIGTIFLGSSPNDGTGTNLREGGQIINDNFQALNQELVKKLEKESKVVNPDIVLEKNYTHYSLSISANTTITFNTSQLDNGFIWKFTLKLSMPALKTLTWPTNIYWYGGSDFSRVGDYYYDFYSEDNGVHWTATKFFENTQYVNPLTNKIWYVDSAKADDTLSGLTWANAKKNVQAAIDAAIAGDIVFVKAGTYLPTTGSERSKTITLKTGVHLYGGFQGNETSPAERMMSTTVNEVMPLPYGDYTLTIQTPTYPSILSGDLDGDSVEGGTDATYGNRLTNITNNAYTVVTSAVSATTIVNGFTVTGGNGVSNAGGVNGNLSTYVINCIIKNNSTIAGGGIRGCNVFSTYVLNNSNNGGNGGGVHSITGSNLYIKNNNLNGSYANGAGSTNSTLFNSKIYNNVGNTTNGTGGGSYIDVLYNCIVSFNRSYRAGGTNNSNCTNCLIINNSTTDSSGGYASGTLINSIIANNSSGNLFAAGQLGTLINCLIANNSASAAVNLYNCTITNCTVVKNLTPSESGISGNSIVKNTVVWGNRNTGGSIHNITLGTGSANYCAFENEVVAGTANISLTTDNAVAGGPYFINPSLAAGITEAATDYDITTDSALKNTGNSAYLTTGEGSVYDIKHRNRKSGSSIDIGAYEFQE